MLRLDSALHSSNTCEDAVTKLRTLQSTLSTRCKKCHFRFRYR